MTIKAIETTRKIEDIFNQEMKTFLERFASEITTKKCMLIAKGKGVAKHDKSFGIEIYLYDVYKEKEIKCQFVIYIDFYGGDRFFSDIWINNKTQNRTTDNVTRYNFRLKDYCTFRSILFPEKFEKGLQILSIIDDWIEVESYLIEYISFVKDMINQDEMQKILFTDYWINVPIDWSPYK